jgi:hypothetical protein
VHSAHTSRYHGLPCAGAILAASLALVLALVCAPSAAAADRAYCKPNHKPKGCVQIPKSAQRPKNAPNQGSGTSRRPIESGGGYGGGPRSAGDRGRAVKWAEGQMGSEEYAWRCERFVEEAYGTSGIFDTAKDAAKAMKLHRGWKDMKKAPRGALIYFRADESNQDYGHVGIALGKGKMISALRSVTTTDISRGPYWKHIYLGWTNAPVDWPGRAAEVPPPDPDPGISIKITGPSLGATLSGPASIYVTTAGGVAAVELRAYYASNPRDATTRAWHYLGNAAPTGTAGVWALTFDSRGIPDQNQPRWGTVKIEAIAIDAQGVQTGNRDARRFAIDNVTAVSPAPIPPPVPTDPEPTPTPTYPETTGGVTHTWTNYTNAGGTEGPTIPSNQTVMVACKVQGFRVADGNTWWYRIASSPWNNVFYASADAFYNNGQTSGSLHGTPFVDPAVPLC